MLASPTFRTMFKEKERNVLDLFTVEGEGGYLGDEYSFMFKSSAFFTPAIANKVAAVVKDPSRIKNFIIPGTSTTVKYMDNVLRIALGNKNSCIMYRDGKVDISKKTYDYPYLNTIMYDIKDTFCPSSYATAPTCFQQMLLLKNGDLIYVNTYSRTNGVVALTGVQKFLTKNQAHRSDAIVGCENGDVYHVWVGPTPNTGPSHARDGNLTASGIIKINGIKHTDLLFCTIGDAPANAIFCLKSDPQNLYRFVKGYGINFKITGLGTTPLTGSGLENMKLTGDEYYIDGMAQEFNSLFLTNKRMIHRSSNNGSSDYSYIRNTWLYGWEKDLYPVTPTALNPIIKAKKIVTPTAYSMIVEDVDGKYWLCDNNGTAYVLKKPVSYTFFDQLKTYLIPIRELNK
jgi:hypothetical protein